MGIPLSHLECKTKIGSEGEVITKININTKNYIKKNLKKHITSTVNVNVQGFTGHKLLISYTQVTINIVHKCPIGLKFIYNYFLQLFIGFLSRMLETIIL